MGVRPRSWGIASVGERPGPRGGAAAKRARDIRRRPPDDRLDAGLRHEDLGALLERVRERLRARPRSARRRPFSRCILRRRTVDFAKARIRSAACLHLLRLLALELARLLLRPARDDGWRSVDGGSEIVRGPVAAPPRLRARSSAVRSGYAAPSSGSSADGSRRRRVCAAGPSLRDVATSSAPSRLGALGGLGLVALSLLLRGLGLGFLFLARLLLRVRVLHARPVRTHPHVDATQSLRPTFRGGGSRRRSGQDADIL